MAEWLEQVSQWHEMYCHNLEVMSSNPSRVELGVLGTAVQSHTWIRIYIMFLEMNTFIHICVKDQKVWSSNPTAGHV